MNNRMLYLVAIVGNFLLLCYALILIVGIGVDWTEGTYSLISEKEFLRFLIFAVLI